MSEIAISASSELAKDFNLTSETSPSRFLSRLPIFSDNSFFFLEYFNWAHCIFKQSVLNSKTNVQRNGGVALTSTSQCR